MAVSRLFLSKNRGFEVTNILDIPCIKSIVDKEIIIKFSPKKTRRTLFILFSIMIISLFIMINGGFKRSYIGVFFLFWSIMIFAVARKFFEDKVYLAVNENGIYYDSKNNKWKDIKNVFYLKDNVVDGPDYLRVEYYDGRVEDLDISGDYTDTAFEEILPYLKEFQPKRIQS